MAKRTASSELNHMNWDREDEPEEAGSFQRANDDVLKKRVIKTARRRNPISSVRETGEDDSAKPNVFGTFTGFKKTPPPSSTAFSFLSSATTEKKDEHKTNGTSTDNQTTSAPAATFKSPFASTSKVDIAKDDEYLAKLKGLNESVSKWIKRHVDSNPFINLTPVFKDYERYFSELESQKNSSNSTKSDTVAKDTSTSTGLSGFKFGTAASKETGSIAFKSQNEPETSKATSTFSFAKTSDQESTKTTPFALSAPTSATTFTFGTSKTGEKKDAAPTNTFGFFSSTSTSSNTSGSIFGGSTMSATPTTSTTGFSFSGSSPFTFKNTAAPPTSTDKPADGENEDDEEPPKVEFKPVEEDGHIYKVRCKVFVKKGDAFSDRGVGNLFLKPIENSEKSQLIVRADTNLGNLLCNFILSEGIPIQRRGKKDVMLVCLPTPETAPPPIPILLRVKSPEDADELLKTLEKYKK